MCAKCKKTFGHNLELHIHTKTYHKEVTPENQPQQKSDKPPAVKEKITQKFQCTECEHKGNKEDDIIKHIEKKHASVLSPAKLNKSKAAPPKQRYRCTECSHEGKDEEGVIKHIECEHGDILKPATKVPTQNKVNTDDILLLGSSHMNSVMPTKIERALKCKVFTPGRYPGAGRMYCSKSDWPEAKFPQNSMDIKVPELLRARTYKTAVLMSPDNDLSNLKSVGREEQYRKAELSVLNTIKVAENALEDFPNLEKVLLLEYLPRADQLGELVDFSNFVLKEVAKKATFGNRIEVMPLTNVNPASYYDIFGSPNYFKFDGVHLRGKQGSWLLTQDIINGIKSSNQTQNSWKTASKGSRPQSTPRQAEEVTISNKYNLLN